MQCDVGVRPALLLVCVECLLSRMRPASTQHHSGYERAKAGYHACSRWASEDDDLVAQCLPNLLACVWA